MLVIEYGIKVSRLMEVLRHSEQLPASPILQGVPLRDLVTHAAQERQDQRGAPISERVLFLAEAMETSDFWMELNQHLATDPIKRQSVGGVFFRGHGKRQLADFTWQSLFTSLDHFLTEFDLRATEYIFRYFRPQSRDERTIATMISTRNLALDRYPRLRRAYWDDYVEALNTPLFWEHLGEDLSTLPAPVATNKFFPKSAVREWESPILRDISPQQQNFQDGFKVPIQNERKILKIKYADLRQIVRDQFNTDARTFLLQFTPSAEDPDFLQVVDSVKRVLEERVLPTRTSLEGFRYITKEELDDIVANLNFWQELIADIEQSLDSRRQVFTFSMFLRHFDRERGEIAEGKMGSYAHLATAFTTQTQGKLRDLIRRPSAQLVHYLMWQYKPNKETDPHVQEAKTLCEEIFPQDCLFVRLQTDSFWQGLQMDLQIVEAKPTFFSFLRYYTERNPSCNIDLHEAYTGNHKDLLHRAYHKEKEFIKFVRSLGIKSISNYRKALVELFKYAAPVPIVELLQEKFPQEFSKQGIQEASMSKKRYSQAQDIVRDIALYGGKNEVVCKSKEEAIALKRKVQSAARIQAQSVGVRIQDNILVVKPGSKRTPEEKAEIEGRVKELRIQGMQNKDIAQYLGIHVHDVEYAVTKLIKKGEISARSKF